VHVQVLAGRGRTRTKPHQRPVYVDPRNWGAANLAPVETDVDIQQAMLDEFNNMAQQAINEHDEESEASSVESVSEIENTTHQRKDNQSMKQHKAKQGRSVSVLASQGMENLIDRVAGNKRYRE